MSIYAEVRALMPDVASAKKPGEVVAALPHAKAQRIRESIGYMFRCGILDRIGNRSDGFAYYVKRQPKLTRYATPEEAAEAKRQRDARYARERMRNRGCMPMAEYRALQAQRKAATVAKKEAEKAERRQRLADKRMAEKIATEKAKGTW